MLSWELLQLKAYFFSEAYTTSVPTINSDFIWYMLFLPLYVPVFMRNLRAIN